MGSSEVNDDCVHLFAGPLLEDGGLGRTGSFIPVI